MILKERIDDAVTRILKVKVELGLFEDPMQEKLLTKQPEPGSRIP